MGGDASISVLGGFDVRTQGVRLNLPATAERVLGFLALSGTRQNRDVVAGRLWSFTSQARAQANLRTALWQLRRIHSDVIHAARNRIWLSDEVAVDYRTMTDQARRLFSGATADEDLLRVPLELFKAELLPGWDEDWLLIERERHRQLRMHALEDLSRRLVGVGRFALAADVAYGAIAIEPLCESAHRTLTQVFLAEGNRTEALRQYRLYRSLLVSETGFGPTDEFVALLSRATKPRTP
jgi:DNA-binding SARP family transcriptional activator